MNSSDSTTTTSAFSKASKFTIQHSGLMLASAFAFVTIGFDPLGLLHGGAVNVAEAVVS